MLLLSPENVRLVQFARIVQDHGNGSPEYPRKLAELRHACQRAHAAGVRESNTGRDAGRTRSIVETLAEDMGLSTEWPGLWPQFTTANGDTIRIPFD